MDLEQFISDQFHESIAAKMAACEHITPDLADLSELLVFTLLNNNKILTCGNGESAGIAQQFSLALMHRLERERPALPTYSLNQDALSLVSIATTQGPSDIYARQILGLGREGDTLLIVTQDDDGESLQQAIRAAHQLGMTVALLGGPDNDALINLLSDNDIDVSVPVEASPRLTEIHLLATSCVIELIEVQLFGSDL